MGVSERPATLEFLIKTWFGSESQLLQRLALFGIARCATWTADEKIKWLLDHDLLYDNYGSKHEVFLVVNAAYPSASKESRTAFLDRATRVDETDIDPRKVYNLLYWVTKVAPDCELAGALFDEFVARHPEFGPSEHPDMDGWVGPVTAGLPSPLTVEEVHKRTPVELVNYVAEFKSDDAAEIIGLAQNVRDAASQSYDWSIEVARLMISRKVTIPELWGAVISAWRQLGPGPQQWETILTLLDSNPDVCDLAQYEVSHLLEEGTKGTTHDIPFSLFQTAKAVARHVWSASERSGGSREQAEDWLFVAINHPAGTLLTFWLRMLSKTRQQFGDDWTGLLVDDEHFLSAVGSGTSYAAELGRVLVASHVNFLLSLDEQWTLQNIVTLFDVRGNLKRAIQAWHGFLVWGGWNDRLLDHLLPSYINAFPVLHSEFGKVREAFCTHLAGIAALSKIDPLSQGWLNCFLSAVTEEERVMWASALGTELKGMEDAAKDALWRKWLGTYWKNRLDGIPVRLTELEGEAMAEWSNHLEPVFPEVVEKLVLTPVPNMKNSFLLTELSESNLPKRYPQPTAAVVLHVLKSANSLPWDTRWVNPLFQSLSPSAEAKTDLRLICEELGRLGYADAIRMKRLLG